MTILQPITLEHEGATLTGLLALPEGKGPFPAVLVMHSALGLGDQVKQTAQKLAALGYAALAADMYGVVVSQADQNAAGAAMQALYSRPELLRSRTIAWFEALRAAPQIDASRMAAIGYCMGGQCVLELARSGADVQAVVSFHGLLTTKHPAAAGAIKGIVAVWTGARDPYAPEADVIALRAEMEAAQADLQLTIFSNAAHGFTDMEAAALGRPGIEYDALADALSWAGTEVLLKAKLGN